MMNDFADSVIISEALEKDGEYLGDLVDAITLEEWRFSGISRGTDFSRTIM